MKRTWTVYAVYEKRFDSIEDACRYAGEQVDKLRTSGYVIEETTSEVVRTFESGLSRQLAKHDVACENRLFCDGECNEAAVSIDYH